MSNLSVPSYSVCQKVGEGSMCEVFRATSGSGEVVALKAIKSFLKSDSQLQDRLEKEGRTLERLSDERIVRFRGLSKSSDGRLVLIQEFVDGENIEVLLGKTEVHPEFLPLIAISIVTEILLGLEEAHRFGVVHRDLKPENVLLLNNGRLKITDFGIAKNLESEELTVTGLLVGSPAYMSPEQAMGEKLDQRSDLFSLGILLYKISTGSLPFRSETYSGMIRQIAENEPPAAESLNPYIHPELKKIIDKALSKNIDERYQRAYAFRYDLMEFLEKSSYPSPHNVLRLLAKGCLADLDWNPSGLVETMIKRAEDAFGNSQKEEGTQLLKQVFYLDPQNEKAQELLKPKRNFRALVAMLALFLFGLGAYQIKKNVRDQETTKIVKVAKPDEPSPTPDPIGKKIESIKEVVPRPSGSAPVVSARPTINKAAAEIGWIKFNVDPDTSVFFNGKKIDPSKRVSAKSGKHKIKLSKAGYPPIESFIVAKANKVTTVNARTGK